MGPPHRGQSRAAHGGGANRARTTGGGGTGTGAEAHGNGPPTAESGASRRGPLVLTLDGPGRLGPIAKEGGPVMEADIPGGPPGSPADDTTSSAIVSRAAQHLVPPLAPGDFPHPLVVAGRQDEPPEFMIRRGPLPSAPAAEAGRLLDADVGGHCAEVAPVPSCLPVSSAWFFHKFTPFPPLDVL